jgi:hypothetical protein
MRQIQLTRAQEHSTLRRLLLIAAILIVAATPAIAEPAMQVELKIGNVEPLTSYVTVTMLIPETAATWLVKCVVLNRDGDPLAAEENADVRPPAHSMTLRVGDRASEATGARCLGQPQ